MMQVLVFLAILSLVVLIHEWGHYITAKIFKIKVEEFGFGYPPRALKLFVRKGTLFTLNWLPLGGFVKLYGENGEGGEKKVKDARAFYNKPIWQRSVVLLAGVVMNFVLGVVLFGIIYSVLGIPTELKAVKVVEVVENSPAAEIGLKEGEIIKSISKDREVFQVENVSMFISLVNENVGEEIVITKQDGQTLTVTPRVDPPEGQGALGVVVSDTEMRRYPLWQMPFRGMWVGLLEALMWGREILFGLYTMVSSIFGGSLPKDIAGPVGIYQITNEVRKAGILPLMQFVAVLSINLAILNILPIPALDGGRLVFLFVELLRGRRVREEIEGTVNAVGMALLLGLMLLVTLNDVLRLVGGVEGIAKSLGL